MGKNRKYGYESGSCLGVDVSATRVKLLELDGRPDNIRVASYASEPLPANAVSDHQIINVDAVGQTIARALKKAGTRTRDAAIAVTSAAVISATISLPAEMDDDEIEQQVMFEAPQHIPYPIENISLDFQPLGRVPGNTAHRQVLLVACRRDNVETCTAVLEVAKLRPRLVDVEEYALRNACHLLHEQTRDKGYGKTVVFVELGALQTRLNVQHDRHTLHAREIAFGGRELAAGLAARHGLDDARPLGTGLHEGRIQGSDIPQALGLFCDQAAQHINSTLQYGFSTGAMADSIDRILLTGGCTLYPDFENQMRNRLRWPVACANPLRGIISSSGAKRNHVERDGPTLMTAAGLSLRSIM